MSSATAGAFPTARWTGSGRTSSSSSIATSSCSAPTTSARSSTTGRGASARTRSSGTTRRCRRARCSRSRTRLDLPELPRVRDRASPRVAGVDDPQLVAGASCGLVGPAGLQRRVDLRADRDARAARGRLRLGLAPEGRGPGRRRVLRRRRDLRGGGARGRDLRRGHEGARRSSSATTTSGRSRRRCRSRPPRRAWPTKPSGTGCRASASTVATCSRSTTRHERPSSERARARGRRSSRPSRTEPRRMRRPTTRRSTSIPSGYRRSARTSAWDGTSAISCGSAS